MVPPHVVAQTAVAAALLGAMSWSLATYYFGIPVSETHGLIEA
jgi:phosphate/sulfate permease